MRSQAAEERADHAGGGLLWKKQFEGPGGPALRELRQLRQENARLKRLVADLSLGKHILQEVLKNKA